MNATLTALMDISEAETGTMALAPRAGRCSRRSSTRRCRFYADEAEDRGIALRVDVDPEVCASIADRTRLRQVLANLIENAVKYTDRGGRVDIDAAADGGKCRP